MNVMELDKTYVAGTYRRFPVQIVGGKGSILRGADGRDYIDMGAGIAVNTFGVGDAAWEEAVIRQLHAFQHTSNLYYSEPCAVLAQMLCQRTGMRKVFFSNSGAEANECAIKAARKYAAEKKGEGAYQILTLRNSFHGRTLTTLAATGQDAYHKDFLPLTEGFASVEPTEEALRAAVNDRTAAILFEIVRGEGGVLPLEPSFVLEMVRIAAEKDILLIADEVQCGNGRSGTLYAYMQYGFTPDIVTTAKGLGGGLPIGATLLGEKVQDVFTPGTHGSTFGGNPVVCAGAIRILSGLDEATLQGVRERSAYLQKELNGSAGISEVTGMGLMLGLTCRKTAAQVEAYCREHGVLVLTAKSKVRLLPALNIPMELLAKAVQVIKEACKSEVEV